MSSDIPRPPPEFRGEPGFWSPEHLLRRLGREKSAAAHRLPMLITERRHRHTKRLANLDAILAAAGCTFDDVVDVTVFIVDPASKLETIWKVVGDYWGEAPHPTLTGIGVTWLYGFDFEI